MSTFLDNFHENEAFVIVSIYQTHLVATYITIFVVYEQHYILTPHGWSTYEVYKLSNERDH